MTNRPPVRDCWPATARDWLAAQSRVRLGRLDRYSAIRRSRGKIVGILARRGSSVLFDTDYGFEIFLPASDCGMMMMALRGILFHSSLLEIVKRAIRPGDTVIDGGSNIGFFALLSAAALRGSGRVLAFEPAPETFSLLQQNIRRNGFEGIIQAEPLALTDREGVFDFSVDNDESTLSSLISRSMRSPRTIRVRGKRLDDFLRESGMNRADIIKLDLEGAEPMALEGAREILLTARMLIFEANEPQLQQLGVDPVQLVERTAAAGRFDTVLFIDERSEKICRWDTRDFEEALRDYKFINVVCARANSFEARVSTTLQPTGSSSATEASRL